jgi:hypothetical protein
MKTVIWNGRYTGYGLDHVNTDRESIRELRLIPCMRSQAYASDVQPPTSEEELIIQENTISWFGQNGLKYASVSCNAAVVSVCWAPFRSRQVTAGSASLIGVSSLDTAARIDAHTTATTPSPSNSTTSSETEAWLCVLHLEGLKLIAPSGQELDLALPCKMHSIHALPFGLLLVRDKSTITSNTSNRNTSGIVIPEPILFVLRHPLEEVVPVAYHQAAAAATATTTQSPPATTGAQDLPAYVEDSSLSIVFTSPCQPIVATYHTDTKIYSLWQLHHRASVFDSITTPHTIIEHVYDLPMTSDPITSMFLAGSGLLDRAARQLILCVLYNSTLFELHTYCITTSPKQQQQQQQQQPQPQQTSDLQGSSAHDHQTLSITPNFILKDVVSAIPVSVFRTEPLASASLTRAARSHHALLTKYQDLDLVVLVRNSATTTTTTTTPPVQQSTMKLFVGKHCICDLQLPTALSSIRIVALSDAVNGNWNVITDRGVYHRIHMDHGRLPHSQLVWSCINAAALVLSEPQTVALLRAVVSESDSGGSVQQCAAEWQNFVEHIRALYLNQPSTRNVCTTTAAAATVATTTTSTGTSDSSGWEYLVNSIYHYEASVDFAHLALPSTQASTTIAPLARLQAASIQHVESLLRVLHLVYESRKINTAQWNELAPLSQVLYDLARAANKIEYVDLYARDAFAANLASMPPPSGNAEHSMLEQPLEIYHACLQRDFAITPEVLHNRCSSEEPPTTTTTTHYYHQQQHFESPHRKRHGC